MNFFKKIFLIIVTFLVTISLSTLFISCPPKPTEEIIEKTIGEVTITEEAELKTEEEAEETIIEITEEKTEEEITEATEKAEREPKINELVEEYLKAELPPLFEEEFKIKVTKVKFQNDKLDLAYNTRWFVDETIQKEMFDIVKALSTIFSSVENKGFAISATSDRGKTLKSETSQEIQDYILNLEISFEEWVQECIIK